MSAKQTLKRNRPNPDDELEGTLPPTGVSAGPVDRLVELTFNPTREKLREVTVVDRMQGRLFPLLDLVNSASHYVIEIATFRESKETYRKQYRRAKPVPIDMIDELLYRTAQWQKSVAGRNLERATDIALAETESRGGMIDDFDAVGRRLEE